jgi:hypothetical protein
MNSLVQANENARATSDILAVSVEGPVGGVIKLIRTTERLKLVMRLRLEQHTSEGGRKLSCVLMLRLMLKCKPKHTEKTDRDVPTSNT